MTGRHAQNFMDALHGLEKDGSMDRLVEMFSDHAELRSPAQERTHRGKEGAKAFWDAYQRSFEEIHSDFRNVTESDDAVILEWTSRGRLASGSTIEYDGVSVVEHQDDQIRRFRTYFDPGALKEQVSTPTD